MAKFICLAAGRGSRMQPLTSYVHKAMIPFHGLPLLAYSLSVVPVGEEVTLVVGNYQHQIEGYFGSEYRGHNLKYLRQPGAKGTGAALKLCSAWYSPKEPVIVWQADQLVWPGEFEMLDASPADTVVNDAVGNDVGLWKLKPETLACADQCTVDGEQRALASIEQQGPNRLTILREKLELSFDSWPKIEAACARLRRLYPTVYR